MGACLHVIQQYINAQQPARAAEYDECVRRNLANPYVAALHNLCEPQVVVPEEFRHHPKYREHRVSKWLTYQAAFEYANHELVGEVVCVCNLDIFLDAADSDWTEAARIVQEPIVLCLSRIEYNGDGSTFKDPGFERIAFANTQDAWVFRSPIEVPESDFELGTLGCDNAIAHRIKKAGRQPVNAPNRFKIFHYDRCRGKDSGNQLHVHAHDRHGRGYSVSTYPEKQGCYLVPDFDAIRSVDALLSSLGVSDMHKYEIICDIVSRYVKIDNSPR